MNWNFLGMENWPARRGTMDLLQSFDVFRATESAALPRATCEGCIVWRDRGCCAQVQVEDWEEDARCRESDPEGYKDIGADCLTFRNCCPILFFDYIGIPLPVLKMDLDDEPGTKNQEPSQPSLP